MRHAIVRDTDRSPEEARMMIVLGLLRSAVKRRLMELHLDTFHQVAVRESLDVLDSVLSIHRFQSVTPLFTLNEKTGHYKEVDAILERLAAPQAAVAMLTLSLSCIRLTQYANGLIQKMLADDLALMADENRLLLAPCDHAIDVYISCLNRSE